MQSFKRSFKLSEIDAIAAWMLQSNPTSHIICFEGELGAGKTTLIKAVCRKLGVKENVSSPTYSLLNVYHTEGNKNFQEVIHIDLYRLSGEEEAKLAACVHDEIMLLVREEYKEKWKQLVKRCMEEAEAKWLGDVPAVADVKSGRTWAETH